MRGQQTESKFHIDEIVTYIKHHKNTTWELEIGKEYIIYEIAQEQIGDTNFVYGVKHMDKVCRSSWYDESCFMSRSEVRKLKLKKLNNVV